MMLPVSVWIDECR